jgi:hypothetical protein
MPSLEIRSECTTLNCGGPRIGLNQLLDECAGDRERLDAAVFAVRHGAACAKSEMPPQYKVGDVRALIRIARATSTSSITARGR